MAKEIDKIIQSKTAPKSNNVLWDDGENLKINRNGKWENANNAETNNLDIDPIVWKYLCNPYVIDVSDAEGTIPKDIIPIIFNKDRELKPIVQNLITFVNNTVHGWSENKLYYNEDGSIIINNDGTWENV